MSALEIQERQPQRVICSCQAVEAPTDEPCPICNDEGMMLRPIGTDYPISYSGLKLFAESIPAFEAAYVIGQDPRESSPAMGFGKLLHRLLFEPEKGLIAVAPTKPDFKGDMVAELEWIGSVWANFYSEVTADHVVIQSDDELELATAMIDSLWSKHVGGSWRYPQAVALLQSNGQVEHYVEVEDQLYGLRLQAIFDKLIGEREIVDLKSTRSIQVESFARDAANFGYYIQDWFYRRVQGLKLSCKPQEVRFSFLVGGKQPPHEWTVYELDASSCNLGRARVEHWLTELSDHIHQRTPESERVQWESRFKARRPLRLPKFEFSRRIG